LSCSCRTLLRL